MAAPVGLVGRCRFALKSSHMLLISRTFASKTARIWRRIAKEPRVNVKRNDNVYLMSYRDPPQYTFTEAMSCLRAFDISLTEVTEQIIELYVRIDMGEKKKEKMNPFHGLLLLPKPYGRERKVLVFAKEEAAEAARNAGGNIVGGEELIKQVAAGEITDFDQCLCTLEFLDKMRPLRQVLKEKMPTTRRGTASDDIAAAIETYKKGHPYKCDKEGIINIGVGQLNFTDSEVRINTAAVLSTITSHRIATKGEFFKELIISSTRGPRYPLHTDEWVS